MHHAYVFTKLLKPAVAMLHRLGEVSPVFGRYGGCSSDQKDDKRIPSNNTGVAVLTWFHHRLEERSQTNSQDRISGFSDHLTENDDLIATVEGQVTQP